MTTSVAPQAPSAHRFGHRSVPLRALRPTIRVQAPVWAWFWGLMAAVAVVLAGIPARYDLGEMGVWGAVDAAPRWFAFSLLLAHVATGTAPHVAHGMTRRAFVRLVAVLAALTAVAAGLVWTVGYAVERTLTGRSVPDLAPLAAEHVVAILCYSVTGALVGATYLRGGPWWGTLTLPLTFGPLLATEAYTSSGWQGAVGRAIGFPEAPQAVALVLPVLVSVLLLVVVDRVLHRAALRPASGLSG
ncbi:hypothetical protein ICW40_07800 [Actinotalea ferrariae]|uniref:hypothetical protein n=1 Tax=Actinotalea ferrariae TaxID=1386098 RepID=UPI001C8CDC32|nr:hypothetical protein [Actinotalea ferrariae]MBX9244713.1 hypothetical protein [Actinotalea ferrariae]